MRHQFKKYCVDNPKLYLPIVPNNDISKSK